MTTETGGIFTCRNTCWIAAALMALGVFMLLSGGAGLNVAIALIGAVAVLVGLALLLQRAFCVAPAGAEEHHAAQVHDVAATKDAVADADHVGQSELATTPHMPEAEREVHSTDLEPPLPEAGPSGEAEAGETGAKPQALAGPRGGQADDLKKIKGVGRKLEELLHSLGIYHFDQIAEWSEAEIRWMDENLKGFRGRVSRDGWVEQARTLASGGETEFSRRVEGGDVYE